MLDIKQEPVFYAIPLFAVVIAIELIINAMQARHLYKSKDTAASIAMGLGSLVIGAGVKIVAFAAMTAIHQFAIFDIGYQWWAWVLILFADDFSFYWHHRLSHEVRILWAAHVNHHSSVYMNFGTALRQSWAEQLYKYIFWMWLPLVGFHPIMIMTMMSISLIFQFLQHTELVGKLGPLEWIFNTPSHHRVHHASNARYLDRNHAGILIIWDRLFGTFSEELDKEKPKYGITTNITTYNPLKIATHEYAAWWQDMKRSTNWRERFFYTFGPPGWSPDGKHQTAKELRRQLKLSEEQNQQKTPAPKQMTQAV